MDPLGLGDVSKHGWWFGWHGKQPFTAPYYVYRVIFESRDLPELTGKQYIWQLPKTEREVWVFQRQQKNALIRLDPRSRWEKVEARKCEHCGFYRLGSEAQFLRYLQELARMKGEVVGPCSCLRGDFEAI